ncbi:MAG: S1/P1 Nuclease [Caulobacterales bacterium]
MSCLRRLAVGFTAVLVCAGASGEAFAWGATGHRMIGVAAIRALPADLPDFLRGDAAATAMGELSREPDRSKGAGKAHDADRDPGHFIDIGDDGRILGGPAIGNLPATREEYEGALRAVYTSSWRAGYLPYSIIEDWQQLTLDLAYWRVDVAATRNAPDPAHRAWFEADRKAREALVLSDLGALSHMVGDGSQPLHVSMHYNGWGPYPNPNGYTQEKVHTRFEGVFVRDNVTLEAVQAKLTPFHDCGCPIERRTADYLTTTAATVIPFYELQKAGAFTGSDARGSGFAAGRLAAGASELRDLIVLAWTSSRTSQVGWPAAKVSDVEAGKIDPYDSLFGED